MARQHGDTPVLAEHRSGGTSRPCGRGWGRFSGSLGTAAMRRCGWSWRRSSTCLDPMPRCRPTAPG